MNLFTQNNDEQVNKNTTTNTTRINVNKQQ